jgi:iron complex outermembrane receptor protein
VNTKYSQILSAVIVILSWITIGPTSVAEAAETASSSSTDTTTGPGLEEIVVTARKRTESLENVPVAISVVSADAMLQNNQLSLQDYYTSVPGLSITDFGNNGKVAITVRGMSTGTTGNPTVGITIDDVPVGTSQTALINGTGYIPELDPADLQRVEFLKGPQGTLYGASSMGGVMRYVTAVPDVTKTSGHVEVDGSVIPDGGAGYGVRAGVNVPVIPDILAVRGSFFDRHDPAWVDDPAHNESNVNGVDVYGGRLDTLYRAADNFSVRVSAMIQRQEGDGDSTVDTNASYQPVTGYYDQNRLPGTGNYANETQLYTATLNFQSDVANITSITAYSKFRDDENDDVTESYGQYADLIFGVPGSAANIVLASSKFSEEFRVSSPTGGNWDWQLGAFYTSEDNGPNDGLFFANNLQTGANAGLLLNYPFYAHYHEYAGFGDVTYHFTNRFDLQFGARESHNWQDFSQDITGPLEGPAYLLSVKSDDSSFTYLVTPEFRISDDIMTYVRIATGYMPGGPNTPSAPNASIPAVFGPSTTVNYELGVKSRLLDRRLSIDADVFYIDWSKIQLTGFTPAGFTYAFNGGKAKSEGVELSTEFKPIGGLTLSAAAAYIDAVLVNNAGAGFPGVSGDWLPFSSRYSANISADERFALTGAIQGFIGGDVSYVGKRYEGFPPSLGEPQPLVPSYTYGNVHTGFAVNGYTVTAFVKNVTNDRGVLSTQQQFAPATTLPLHTAFITPRTVGISILKQF